MSTTPAEEHGIVKLINRAGDWTAFICRNGWTEIFEGKKVISRHYETGCDQQKAVDLYLRTGWTILEDTRK